MPADCTTCTKGASSKREKETLGKTAAGFGANEGACVGELKGVFTMKDANNAQYRFNGDPCVIDFNFEDNQVSLKEQGNCGNHRGIKCYFDDSFTRKKEPKHKSGSKR
jgi:hypothetical protein